MNLSVGIITYNEEKIIKKTLDSVKNIASEIIIVDSGSTDKTVEIASNMGATVFNEDWKGYGEQKNSVINKCTKDWILLIDADEVVTKELETKIKKIISDDKNKSNIYKIRLETIFGNKRIKFGGWSDSYSVRLFYNGSGKFNNNEVHENFITDKTIYKIKEPLEHYSYDNIEDYLEKLNKYTSESSRDMKNRGKKSNFIKIYFKSWFKFVRMYIFKLGFLDGYEGYILAKYSSMYVLTKYAKLKELV